MPAEASTPSAALAPDPEMLELTAGLIAAPSINPPGDERAAVAVASEYLRARGIEDLEVAGALPERPNLLARLPGREPGPRLLLCGHLDTKPVGDRGEWSSDPFEASIRDGRLYGLGACDMKGGVAAIIAAAGRIAAAGGPERGELTLALTCDEEGGSSYGAYWLANEGLLEADAAIIPEAAGIDRDWELLALGCRGGVLFRIDLTGATGHTALADRDGGTSATLAAGRLVDRLDREFRKLPGLAVNIGATLEGGTAYGVVAGTASIRCDVRLPEETTPEQAYALVDEVIAELVRESPEVTARVSDDEIEGAPYRVTSVAADSAVAVACREAMAEVLGPGAADEGLFPAATDSLFIQGIAGIPTMPAFGPGRLREAHRPDEYVSVASLTAAPLLLEAAARNFLGS